MTLSTREVIEEKRKLARSLLRRAHEWENPCFCPFVSVARRHAKVILLRSQAASLRRSAETLKGHLSSRGPRAGDVPAGSFASEF